MNDADLIPVVNIVDPAVDAELSPTHPLSGPVVGPGSQPTEGDGSLEYMPMPTSMETFQQPLVPEPDEVDNIDAALAILGQCVTALEHCAQSQQGQLFDLTKLDANNLDLVNQLMGVGEVSITIDGEVNTVVQESVMAGLWRVQSLQDGDVIADAIEVGAVPEIVKETSFKNARAKVDASEDGLPQGTINSPSILVELADAGNAYQRGQSAHVVNLSLLPVSPEDLLVLGQRLGVGPVTILSRGYGNCRIGSTACDHVWWIKYYNSEDALILNTLEVVDVPEVALASVEDIADSAERLSEILRIYQ